MRILHTADWHLGRQIEGRSRLAEQEEFLDTLCEIVDQEHVDLILVAGDIFDSANPGAQVERLYYHSLERLAGNGNRVVVVIGGNHDSPDRIQAADPLAVKHGISLVGYPNEHLPKGVAPTGAGRVDTGPGWMEVFCPGSGESAVICVLAYPSESRLREVFTESLDDENQRTAYSDKIRSLVYGGSTHFRKDAVNLILGHLYVIGGEESDSERQIQLGGAFAVEPNVFGTTADYVSLGHLHRPQEVTACQVPCRYSGSPLEYSFSEAGQQKEVVIVEVIPEKRRSWPREPHSSHEEMHLDKTHGAEADRMSTAFRLERIPLSCGKPLKRYRASTIEEAFQWCSDPRNHSAWVSLEIGCEEPLGTAEVAALRKEHPSIATIRWTGAREVFDPFEKRISEMPLVERFKLFCQRQMGKNPEPELVDLFLELVHDETDDSDAVQPGLGGGFLL